MKLARDLAAGMASSVWTALVGLLVVPVYLRYLGIEAYGLIGFFATTQALMQLLDFGLATTINREVARQHALGAPHGAASLLRTLACIYWSIVGVIALGSIVLGPLVAEHWFSPEALSQTDLAQSVMLLGCAVACRWPVSLYQGVLMGAHRLTTASLLAILMVTIGSVGAVAVLALLSPTTQAFFAWHALVGLLYALAMRQAAWQAVGGRRGAAFAIQELRRVWRFSAGMGGVAISGIVLMQMDKVLLSKILSLDSFGRYALAGLVANALYIMLTPTFNLIYPRLSALVAQGNEAGVKTFYRDGTRLLCSILFPVAAGASAFSYELLLVWTGSESLAREVSPVTALLLAGTALNGAMHFPYALQLAYGRVRIPLMINGVLVVVALPLVTFLAIRFGAIGGAAAWLIVNFLYLLLGTLLTHRVLLRGIGSRWLAADVLLPLLVATSSMGVAATLLHRLLLSPLSVLVIGGFVAAACGIALVAASPQTRRLVIRGLFLRRAAATS